MKIIRGLHNLKKLFGSVVTLGNFDGVHLGHRQLLLELKQQAKNYNVPSVVITFHPQPKEFFAGKQTVARMMRLSEKYLALKSYEIDYLCCLYFDDSLSKLSPQDFVQTILLEKFMMRAIIVGYDFHFGAKRAGDFSLLQRLGNENNFQAIELPAVSLDSDVVSSTRLRLSLSQGDMLLAHKILGRNYSLRGKVIYGDQRGRDLGFPTANINLHRELVPMAGVFVVRVMLDGEVFNGVANIGMRPTFSGERVLLEVHLFAFDRIIYGANIVVEFLHKLRDERRFADFGALIAQIKLDVANAKYYLSLN